MSERYTVLFSTDKNLYTPTSPVVICAGALLKDNETNRVIAQIKFKNILPKEIASILVELTLFDSADRIIGEKVKYTYLDLQLKRDEETGHKEPVFIRETNTRAFNVAVKEVVFSDKTVWASNAEWKSLGETKTLIEYFNDSELVEQYSIDCGEQAVIIPQKIDDIWICTCRKINAIHETECHNCLLNYDTLIENLNTEGLRNNFIKRKYSEGIALMGQGMQMNSCDYLNKAIICFEKSNNFEDSALKITECNNKIGEIKANTEAEKIKQTKKIKKYSVIVTVATVFFIVISVILNTIIIPENKYKQAGELVINRNYGKAIAIYREIYDYKDSKKLFNTIIRRNNVISSAPNGEETLGLKADGTVVVAGYWVQEGYHKTDGWEDIVAIAAGDSHSVGLTSDGKVAVNELSGSKALKVFDWKDIISLAVGAEYTVGLKSDGTVVATGYNLYGECDVSDWKDIVAISAGGSHTVGLKSDGTVVATGDSSDGECNIYGWKDIVAVSVGWSHTVGLKSDGTVVATGDSSDGECNIYGWKDIVAVSAGGSHTVGLKSNGTVVATGSNKYGQCDVKGWRDIVAVSAGNLYTVGLKSDGTLVVAGYKGSGQSNIEKWDLF